MKKVLDDFQKASIELVEAFAEKQDLDFDFFIGDNFGETASFNSEITFSLNEIYYDLATNQPKGLIIEWHNESYNQFLNGNKEHISYLLWTLGKRYEKNR